MAETEGDSLLATASEPNPRKSLRLAGLLLFLTGLLGFAADRVVATQDLATPQPRADNVFFYLFHSNEEPFFALIGAIGLLVFAAGAGPPTAGAENRRPQRVTRGARMVVGAAGLALFVTLGARLGANRWLQDVDLSMDEWTLGFQARIFSHGRISGQIDPRWRPVAFALIPIFVEWKPATSEWLASYLPVSAAIRALFLSADAERWANPVLAGLAVLCLAAILRRLRPEDPKSVWLGLGLLCSSSQFLFTSMTGYSFPAHLLLNLVWIWAYVRQGRAWLLLPWIGFLALGLHNPVPHALFVLPFLWRVFRTASRGWRVYLLGMYALAISVWYAYTRFAGLLSGGRDLGTIFALPGARHLLVQAIHWVLLFAWQTPLLALLMVLPFFWWRTLPALERDLAAGVALSFTFYCLISYDQGHGWGYRYMYAVLGNLVLLGVFAGHRLRASLPPRTAALGMTLLLLPVAAQVPLRGMQVQRFVDPFARAFRYVANDSSGCVVVDPAIGWYSQDLVRNDPFFQTEPRVLFANRISPAAMPRLETLCGGRIHWITAAELSALGLPAWPSRLLPAPESLRKESAP